MKKLVIVLLLISLSLVTTAMAATFTPASPIDAPIDSLFGNWKSEQIELDGEYYSTSYLDMDIEANIDESSIKLNGFLFDEEEVLQYEFSDGVLTAALTGSKVTIDALGVTTGEGKYGEVVCRVLDDGMLSLSLIIENTDPIVFYMNHTEEVPAA